MFSFKKRFFYKEDFVFLTIIFCGWLLVVLGNYRLGTWLSGWDNLHPEFNFSLNISRSLSAVWQEYQGIGLLGGMSHAADLPRQIILWLMSFIFPTSVLRYVWHFSMLLLGPLGVYFFSKKFVKISWSSFIASLFYLFNLATVQYFYVPYESFSGFYGFLPWLLWGVMDYLEKRSSSSLLKFFLISLLATSAFYVQTLFVVFVFIVSLILVFDFLSQRQVNSIFHSFKLVLVIFTANAFWLLPSLFFTITGSHVTTQAKQNLISTPEVQFMNLQKGSFKDLFLLKGYWFEYTDSIDKETVYLLEVWRSYFDQPLVNILGYVLFSLSSLGFIVYLRKKTNRFKYAFLTIFVLQIFILTAGRGIFGVFFTFARDNIPLFGQMFRTVFTKWSVSFVLFYSLGLAFLMDFFLRLNNNFLLVKKYFLALVFFALIFSQVIPVFDKELISKSMTTIFPEEYFAVMDFFDEQDSQARIAYLPAHSLWSWNSYEWDYRGSGFLWYGIKQPVLDRAFDVWSNYNENFYFEFVDAINQKDRVVIYNVIRKYQIKYLLTDSSVITSNSPVDQDKQQFLERTFSELGFKEVWKEGSLSVIDTNIETGFVFSPEEYSLVGSIQDSYRRDDIYKREGDYIFLESESSLYYPFIDINQDSFDSVYIEDDSLFIKETFNPAISVDEIRIPKIDISEYYNVPFVISYNNGLLKLTSEQVTLKLGDKEYYLPSLQSLEARSDKKEEQIILDINNQIIKISDGQSVRTYLDNLVVGEGIDIRLFSHNHAKEIGNDYLVEASDITKKTYSKEVWNSLSDAFIIEPTQPVTEIVLRVPVVPEKIDFTSRENFRNCGSFEQGEIDKKVVDDSVTFTAENGGVICQGFWLENATTKKAHIVELNYQNEFGKSVEYYFENLRTRKSELQNVFGKKEQVFLNLISWDNIPNSQYSFNLESRSFGEISSIDTFESSYLYQLPYSSFWFSGIELGSENSRKFSFTEVTLEKKVGTFFYLLNIESKNDDDVFVLSQSYSPGWIAFSLDNKVVLQHFLYNGWENAWDTTGQSGRVIVFYWPQILEFIGLLIIPLTLIYFVYRSIKT